MKIKRYEYEDLVRDSEKLRIIETMAIKDNVLSRKDILLICGYDTEAKDNVESSR